MGMLLKASQSSHHPALESDDGGTLRRGPKITLKSHIGGWRSHARFLSDTCMPHCAGGCRGNGRFFSGGEQTGEVLLGNVMGACGGRLSAWLLDAGLNSNRGKRSALGVIRAERGAVACFYSGGALNWNSGTSLLSVPSAS